MCSCSRHHDPLADCTCTCEHPTARLPRIEPAANYPDVDSGERPTVVEVTDDAVATARQRVAELRADVAGNLEHLEAEHDRSTTATVRVREAAADLNAARDVDDHQQTVYDQAADDVATARRLLEAAEQHLTQLEGVLDQPPPGDPRVDAVAQTLATNAELLDELAVTAADFRRMAAAVLERFDAEHEAALAEQAGTLGHAHDADLETVDRAHRAELDRLAGVLIARRAEVDQLRTELRQARGAGAPSAEDEEVEALTRFLEWLDAEEVEPHGWTHPDRTHEETARLYLTNGD